MKKGTRLTKKKKIAIAEAICAKYSTGKYTLQSCCKSEGLVDTTFYSWSKQIPEVGAAFKKAQEAARANEFEELREISRTTLKKRLQGYTVTEKKTLYVPSKDGEPEIRSSEVREKYIPPSDTALIFFLTNKDPENFKHRRAVEVSGELSTGSTVDFSKLSDEQVNQLLEIFESQNGDNE